MQAHRKAFLIQRPYQQHDHTAADRYTNVYSCKLNYNIQQAVTIQHDCEQTQLGKANITTVNITNSNSKLMTLKTNKRREGNNVLWLEDGKLMGWGGGWGWGKS